MSTSIYRPGIQKALGAIENLPKDSRRRQKSIRCKLGKCATCSGKRNDPYMRARQDCECACHTRAALDPNL